MKTRLTRLLLAAFAVSILGAGAAQAQIRAGTTEISPFYGYLFGGEFANGSNSLFAGRVDVDDHDTFGIRVGYNFSQVSEFEVQASRSDTHFVSHDSGDLFGPGGERLGDLRIDYFLGYGTFNFGHGRAVPYFTIGAGLANLQPSDTAVPSHDATRFTGSIGGGLKVFVTPHFGFRFDGRLYSTYLNENDTCGNDHDHHHDRHDTHWLNNGELSGGLVFAF
jgi:hypothetical protein